MFPQWVSVFGSSYAVTFFFSKCSYFLSLSIIVDLFVMNGVTRLQVGVLTC